MTLLNQVKTLFQRETVFCVSLVLAVLSALAVRPDAAYLSYPDYRTLALLFCLMLIVAGFRSLGVFERLGRALLRRAGSLRELSIALVLLCFFCSMVITNDVTLITFVPFTLLVFRMIRREGRVLTLVVLETIAANLGSMATPIGNPQNLYLCSAAGLTMAQFARAVLPYAGLSLVLLLAVLLLQRDEPLGEERPEEEGEAAPLSALANLEEILINLMGKALLQFFLTGGRAGFHLLYHLRNGGLIQVAEGNQRIALIPARSQGRTGPQAQGGEGQGTQADGPLLADLFHWYVLLCPM